MLTEKATEIVQKAIKHVQANSNSYYGTDCLNAFAWWLGEDCLNEDFDCYEYSEKYISKLVRQLLENYCDNYKCNNKNCEWCQN